MINENIRNSLEIQRTNEIKKLGNITQLDYFTDICRGQLLHSTSTKKKTIATQSL